MNLNEAQKNQAMQMAVGKGMDASDVIQEALDLLALRDELGSEDFARLMHSLAQAERGEFSSRAEVDAVFSLNLPG